MNAKQRYGAALFTAEGNLRRFGIELFTDEWERARVADALRFLAEEGVPRVDIRGMTKERHIAMSIWLDEREIDYTEVRDANLVFTLIFTDAAAAFECKMRWA